MLKDKNGNQVMLGDTIAYSTRDGDSNVLRIAKVRRIVLDVNYGDKLGRLLVAYETNPYENHIRKHLATIFRWNEVLVLRRAE